jgi:hypothetical protein
MSTTACRIPSWATKVVDATAKDEEFQTSTQQSAHLFRIECARNWHQRIYQAQREAWSQTVQAMMMDTTEVVDSVLETQGSVILDHYNIATMNSPPENDVDNDLLLPLTILSPPPACRLDRQALTEALWHYYCHHHQAIHSNGGRSSSCCTLWLPRLLPTLHATLHLLVKQCVLLPEHNDPHFQSQALHYYKKHQKKRTTSMQQLLLWWAARTSTYDSMVIVLEVSATNCSNILE